jgi:hypothetical protein
MMKMRANLNKPHLWKEDIARSVDLYNEWFLNFAPNTYRKERVKATMHVQDMLHRTKHLRNLTKDELRSDPSILFALRMATAPPIARDRLVGLAGISKSLVNNMELEQRLPPQMKPTALDASLRKITEMIIRLVDIDIFPWLAGDRNPTKQEVYRAATIVADRLCGANADPIVRNAQEKRQLGKIKKWLEDRGYNDMSGKVMLEKMKPGMFAFRLNVPGLKEDHESVNIPVDAAVMPLKPKGGKLPLMIEAKSAGDFTNVNKRRKEEAAKVGQLRRKHGNRVRYILFLCGYFDSGYLGYEASEGIDWVWQHRIDDFVAFGL